MSDVRTQLQEGLRGELYAVFGNRPRLIKAFENLLFDVSTSLPAAVVESTDEADSANASAQSAAFRAEGIALEALSIARDLAVAPPPAAAVLPDIPDDLTAQVMQLHARVAQLERALVNFQEGPTP